MRGPQLETNNLLYELIERQRLIFYNLIIKTAKELVLNFYDILLKVCDDKVRSCEVLTHQKNLSTEMIIIGYLMVGNLMSHLCQIYL